MQLIDAKCKFFVCKLLKTQLVNTSLLYTSGMNQWYIDSTCCMHWKWIPDIHTLIAMSWFIGAASSYSARSSSCKWAALKNLGKMYRLTGTRSMMSRGNSTPAKGIQVIPKHADRYTSWNKVKVLIILNGTASTNEPCDSSRTLYIRKNGHKADYESSVF